MNDGRQRHQARVAVVTFLRHGDDVLLLRHAASSDRFAGRWNGIGGHVEVGENILAAARRELFEEAGVKDATLRLRVQLLKEYCDNEKMAAICWHCISLMAFL